MFKSAYPFTIISAILLSAIVLTSCGSSSKRKTIHIDQQQEADLKATKEAKILAAKNTEQRQIIGQLVTQARGENPETLALEQLLAMSQNPNIPHQSQGQAALQYAELLFEFERPDAFEVAKKTMEKWPNHPYFPHMYNLLAKQWLTLENTEEAMAELISGMQQPQINPYSLQENIGLAEPLLDTTSQANKLAWMLATSLHDTENQDLWLRRAAAIATLDDVLRMRHSERPLTEEQANFYRYFARQRLMVGDYHTVRLTAKILESDMPDSNVHKIVKAWIDNEADPVIVGVLLPLSGKYATYGQQALRGIRLALGHANFEDSIVLRVQDTAGDPETCVTTYRQLLAQNVGWVIGPLLSSNTQALIPFLAKHTPVIALSNKVKLAADSPALFIHSLAKVVQADFMARQAIKQGKQRAVIFHTYTSSAFDEAAAFSKTFTNEGGEIVDVIELKKDYFDYRPDLMSMRYHTDDEMLLAELDEDLYLFSAEQNMDIKMPLGFDSIYISDRGAGIALLAGQMAYVDIRGVQLYGSYRWHDGHLLDDHGRYLNGAQFAAPTTNVSQPSQAILDLKSEYRITWDNDEISPLFALAYDTAMNIAALGSRMGLKGEDAIAALHSSEKFPAVSGDYYFDDQGISQKDFAIQVIRHGKIETIQAVEE
jgi:ABC-type branched-subunit amino acid transport system substrate-binding protein